MAPSARMSWVFVIVATLVLTCLLTLVSAGRPDAPSFQVLHNRQTITWLTWLLMSPLIIVISRRFPFGTGSQVRWLVRHIAIGAVFAAVGFAIASLVNAFMMRSSGAMEAMPGMQLTSAQKVSTVAAGILVYTFIAAVHQVLEYHQAVRDREAVATRLRADLAEAKLATLEGQLHPHFLFNALNSIAALMRIDAAQAEVMLEQLSELLRATLRTNPMQLVPLKEAVHIAEQYLAIERIRFQERLNTEVQVSDDAQQALVPQLLLQPIVENAVRHGIAPLERGGIVRLTAATEGDTLHITVDDNGVGIGNASVQRAGSGVGLRSVRSLLSHLYGEKQSFDVQPGAVAGTVVTIAMPFRTEKV